MPICCSIFYVPPNHDIWMFVEYWCLLPMKRVNDRSRHCRKMQRMDWVSWYTLIDGIWRQTYGDGTFSACCMSPLFGYDALYQDADIHDGSKQPRSSPYSANSGFYYVRSNINTQYFFISLLYYGDLVRKTTSHQQVLAHLLIEHSSLFGRRVKVWDGVTVFPGGYQYQYDRKYMHQLLSGQVHPLVVHMYWTNGKESKVKFLKQLVTCMDSPLYDKTGTSFW
eukprot:CCRYP_014427-RA/>CCRYP_014427-RA protein AED:0.21 eAED:0.25 QI:0/0.33/0.5/1/0/0/4/1646/222